MCYRWCSYLGGISGVIERFFLCWMKLVLFCFFNHMLSQHRKELGSLFTSQTVTHWALTSPLISDSDILFGLWRGRLMATLASVLHSFLNQSFSARLHHSSYKEVESLFPVPWMWLDDLLWPAEWCRSVSVPALSLASLCPSTVSQSPATFRTNLASSAGTRENTLRRAHFSPFTAILDKPKVCQPQNMWVPAKMGRATNPTHTWPQT